ncbi:MAG: glycoside hydrolase family 3 N-terminal domain-containing protein [Cytophagales bacterium]|nr:glycoside hydrolase family 3 protein [Bernardetiaceae bacterium]MDW8211144.1 glycoside hydrolase family 3 N-terminal domain-containing protein [Cytophagales bacterium]
MKWLLFGILFLWLCISITTITERTLCKPENHVSHQQRWVDSLLQTMTDDQKIGQLLMVAAYSNRDEAHYKEIERLITDYHIGGLIFFQGGPARQAILTNRYQRLAKIPLLISIDAEWGLGMRLDSTISFPRAMTLGAIGNNQLIYQMGAEIARQCKRLGIHVNFAPVADVNVNPANPVIGLRSFGENKELVTEKALAYMQGLQQHGIIATAKHFPGHGDTDTDSHYALPVIKHTRQRIEEIELYPFSKLIQNGVMSLMVAHLNLPEYDPDPKKPATLSSTIVSNLLRRQMGFTGLIFTDALNMKGVAANYPAGEADWLALKAGNDCLLFPMDVPLAVTKIKEAISKGEIAMEQIEERVKRILMAKYFAGLSHYRPIPLENLYQDLNSSQAKALCLQLYEQAITVVRNKNNLIPFKKERQLSFASVVIGEKAGNSFQLTLEKYAPFEHFQVSKSANKRDYEGLLPKLRNKKIVIVGLMELSTTKEVKDNYGISQASLDFITKLSQFTKVIPVVFGNPYSLKFFSDAPYLVCAYENNSEVQTAAAKVLFGAVNSNAKLPVSASPTIKAGDGFPVLGMP